MLLFIKQIKMENTSENIFQKKKKLVEVELARTTVRSYMASILNKEGIDYSLKEYHNGIIISVNAQYHRKIEIKVNRKNFMQVIPHIVSVLKTLLTVFDSIEMPNVVVRDCCNNEKWENRFLGEEYPYI